MPLWFFFWWGEGVNHTTQYGLRQSSWDMQGASVAVVEGKASGRYKSTFATSNFCGDSQLDNSWTRHQE